MGSHGVKLWPYRHSCVLTHEPISTSCSNILVPSQLFSCVNPNPWQAVGATVLILTLLVTFVIIMTNAWGDRDILSYVVSSSFIAGSGKTSTDLRKKSAAEESDTAQEELVEEMFNQNGDDDVDD